jgi:hypothetical protein
MSAVVAGHFQSNGTGFQSRRFFSSSTVKRWKPVLLKGPVTLLLISITDFSSITNLQRSIREEPFLTL